MRYKFTSIDHFKKAYGLISQNIKLLFQHFVISIRCLTVAMSTEEDSWTPTMGDPDNTVYISCFHSMIDFICFEILVFGM